MIYTRPRTYTLEVTTVGDNLLDVNDSGEKNCIYTEPRLQLLVWRLAASVPATVKFGVPDQAGPGQLFFPGPKPHEPWFRPATPGEDGRAISVKVSHHTELSNGEWVYMLHAYDTETGQTYATIHSPDGRAITVTNPVIINK
jgi:hypothetical protein